MQILRICVHALYINIKHAYKEACQRKINKYLYWALRRFKIQQIEIRVMIYTCIVAMAYECHIINLALYNYNVWFVNRFIEQQHTIFN